MTETAKLPCCHSSVGFQLAHLLSAHRHGRELLAWGVDAFRTDRIDLIGPPFR
jgi:hypothetical protein